MSLQSRAFGGDPKLEAAAVSDPAHITQGAAGDYVRKIQRALILLDSAAIAADGVFGPATARAVLAYKTKRSIVNRSYQTQPDAIVGKMTMARLDQDMVEWERTHAETEDELNAEIDSMTVRMCLYPGGVRSAIEIRQLRASVTASKSPEYVGATAIEVGAVALLFLLAIFAIVALMRLAQRSANVSEVNRLKRELDEKIARFNHMVNELVVQGGIVAAKAIAEIIRLIEREQNANDQEADECQKNAPDPNRWKECLDEKIKLKQAQNKLERLRQNLKSAARGKQYDEKWANDQWEACTDELFNAMLNYKSCMGCYGVDP